MSTASHAVAPLKSAVQWVAVLAASSLMLAGCSGADEEPAAPSTVPVSPVKLTGPVVTNPKFPPPKQTNVDREPVTIDGCAIDFSVLVPLKFDPTTAKRDDRIANTTHLGCKLERHLPRRFEFQPTLDVILGLVGTNVTMAEVRAKPMFQKTMVERPVNGREAVQVNTFDIFSNAYLVFLKTKEGTFEISVTQADNTPAVPPADLIHQIAVAVEPFLRRFD